VEPSFVIKGGWAERFWTVIVSKDAAMGRATEAQVSLVTEEIVCPCLREGELGSILAFV
jgi:hypothetical protein